KKNPKLKNISRSLYCFFSPLSRRCLLLKFAMDKRSAIKDDLDTKVNLNKQKDLIAAVQKVERSDQSDYEEEDEPTNTGGSKTLVAFNLSFQVERSDVEEFFKEAGQVVDVRFAKSKYGDGRFLGFGIVYNCRRSTE
ncbi:unnamed protein product, partial [Brassica oleracea var. botrytis]